MGCWSGRDQVQKPYKTTDESEQFTGDHSSWVSYLFGSYDLFRQWDYLPCYAI